MISAQPVRSSAYGDGTGKQQARSTEQKSGVVHEAFISGRINADLAAAAEWLPQAGWNDFQQQAARDILTTASPRAEQS